jgi:hypothetical protein
MVAKSLVGVAALAAVAQAFIPTPVNLGSAFGAKASTRASTISMSAVAAKPSATAQDLTRVRDCWLVGWLVELGCLD